MAIFIKRILMVGAATLALAACDNVPTAPAETQEDTIAPEAVPEQATTPLYVGTWAFDPAWCTDQSEGFPITISETLFEGRENTCDMGNMTSTPEGGWIADLSCLSEGTTTQERLALTPIGEQLALTWLDRPDTEATLFSRCS